ncbi:aldolase/citrate lyase family protein [Pseudomonas sp. CAN2814]|uniref:HpcH/HpaI aldolase family protein n=1 Tax=Pseudomonas sp. CAN1 TaxID=3046726 RepID=UPI0026476DAE|nr:aldolase/citrate lyase family protein [Pseudomonas sp. CAN1]MDN6859418.1 aldolase/citrate lyase family protein [Pseudomonas sp. CAN1]
MAEALQKLAFWLSTPHQAMLEIAQEIGYRHVVLDIEHGLFDLEALDRTVALARALGLTVHGKVLGPQTIPIQQALDIGCHSVIIPHIGELEHAREVTRAAKYPPLGIRSFSGTRPAGYGGAGQAYFDGENAKTRCYPMIESAAALLDIEAILALPTVDGVFVGPSDLSLDRGRGAYSFSDADRADLQRIATACAQAGKPWIMPAWTDAERIYAQELGAELLIVIDEYGSLKWGLSEAAR